MEIRGLWAAFTGGPVRPMIGVRAFRADGTLVADLFLIDSGADRTIFSADFFQKLGQPAVPSARPPLTGFGGGIPTVDVATTLQFQSPTNQPFVLPGTFAATTDPAALDFGVLGRDVLDSFDVILSRRRNEVLLLAGNHFYTTAHS
jgi:Aspartyl protease